jgi:hypothetical protein
MKNKVDLSPETERMEFVKRINDLISDSGGSVYALAKKVGIPPNSIRRYLTNSEPTRPFLIAIARTTGVSIQWLATGDGPKILPSSSQYADFVTEEQGHIRERFREVGRSAGSLQKATGINQARLNDILAGEEDATGAEIVQICRAAEVSYAWLLTGVGFPRLFERGTESEARQTSYWQQFKLQSLSLLHADLVKMLSVLRSLDFVTYRVKTDAMTPKINRDDIVIADKSSRLEQELSGTFLIREKGVEEVCYVSKDGSRVNFSYENSKIAQKVRDWDDNLEQFQIVGRVIFRIALIKL